MSKTKALAGHRAGASGEGVAARLGLGALCGRS